jgi:hypothetical protein
MRDYFGIKNYDIENMLEWFQANNEWEAYLMLSICAFFSIKPDVISYLKWSDLYESNGNKKTVFLVQMETGKYYKFTDAAPLFEAVEKYCQYRNISPTNNLGQHIFEEKWSMEQYEKVFFQALDGCKIDPYHSIKDEERQNKEPVVQESPVHLRNHGR